MGQGFSYREMLIEGHGKFGCVDGEGGGGMGYREGGLSKVGMEMVGDLKKDRVNFIGKYDGEEGEGEVLGGGFGNLLVKGGRGIGVGMRRKIGRDKV
ncbi:DNA gyrase subunit A, partial [Leuconostoc mesenteroides]|uniref:DNA gyrase subunit A n=1 Tax=Leuconostoc mesenteroides TaxID=1245 RepID=UPI0028CB8DFB